MSDSTTKPRVRVTSDGRVTHVNGERAATRDSFQNFAANLGYGTPNLSTASSYGFNPISRNHTQLEWMYRGSWIVRKIVDVVAEDMTRAKIQVDSDESPDELAKLDQYWNVMLIWQRLCETIKWARLYGGCLAVIMIDGHNPSDPLNVEAVGEGQFKGLLVLDRWMVWSDLTDVVTDFGTDFGKPKFYTTTSDAKSIPTMRIHHSRCIRIDGIQLPYWQRIAENDWGLSVVEPLFDRLVAFDSTTQGAAQLVYKAHLRTYYIEKLREAVAAGGKAYQAILRQVDLMRLMQTNEGISVLDATDKFEAAQYSFSGLSDMLVQFSQQLSGAADIPLTRLFGQAPAGLNATGESDMRNYYDMCNAQQEAHLRHGVATLRAITYRSRFGRAPRTSETFSFTSLYKMTDAEKASTASTVVQTAAAAFESQLMTRKAAMQEIKQSSTYTGFGSNITDEDIEAATEDDPPNLQELVGGKLDDPLDMIRFQHGLDKGKRDATGGSQPGEEQLTGGREDGEGIGPGSGVNRQTPLNGAVPPPPPMGDRATIRDRRSMIEVHGLPIIIETARGEQRSGRGWRVSMPADYGYISGTGSAEGADEQMDAYVGPNHASTKIFVIEQVHPGTHEFDEHKIMLGFDTEDEARATYCAAFSDGSGPERIGSIKRKTPSGLKTWLSDWRYELPGKVVEAPGKVEDGAR